MVIVGGESNDRGDLNDVWTFDLERKLWLSPPVLGDMGFIPKRFHTVNSFDNGTKMVVFGGC